MIWCEKVVAVGDEELETINFICHACDFVNDNRNINGFKFFLELEKEMKKRFGVSEE